MAQWTGTVSVVSSIFGLLGFIGVILGVITFCTGLAKRARERDAGRVCCDADKMGYFAINEPKWYLPWQYFKKHVPLPIIPEMSAIIRAGDDLAYTSALFDGIPANRDEVCWLPIYEGFFNELAWNQKSSYWDSVSKDQNLKRYAKKAVVQVETLEKRRKEDVPNEIIRATKEIMKEKEKKEKKNKEKEKEEEKEKENTLKSQNTGAGKDANENKQSTNVVVQTSHDLEAQNQQEPQLQNLQQTLTKWLTWIKKLGWIKRLRGLRDGDSDSYLKNQTQKKSYLDRHVLYRPDFKDGPHLWNCVRHLEGIVPESEVEDINKVWIYNKKPCVETSAYELTALSLMLGMRIRGGRDPSTRIGYGASGMSMMSQHTHGFGQLHFAYSSDFEDVVKRPMGSGYSMLFAKHMACGGLPIGLNWGRTMTLMIDDAVVRDKIKKGRRITCDADSEPGDMAVTALFRMPSSRYVFLVIPGGEKKNEDGETTAATDDENTSGEITWPQDQGSQLRKWCEAVAGIAFGGLVPQTTPSLKDAVEFTALGELRWDGDKCFEALRKLVWTVHRRAISRKGSGTGSYDPDAAELTKKLRERFHLFGEYKMRGVSNIDPETSIFDPYLEFPAKDLDTRTAARVFSCYMTLLECAAAQYFHAESSKSVKPAEFKPSPKHPETSSNLLVENIFKACSTELEDAYQRAVASTRPHKIRVRKRSTTPEAEPSSSRPLLIVSKNTDAQMVENEQGETEGHVEPSSTSNNKGFQGVNEGDKTIGSQEESPQGSNDPTPAIEGKDPGRKSSESHQDSIREMPILFLAHAKQPPALFSRKIKDLVKEIRGDGFDGGDSDDEFDDNDDDIYYDSDGIAWGATTRSTPKGNTGEEKSPFTAEVCGKIAHVLIAAWSQQVQIIEWGGNKEYDDGHFMPSPDSFPDILALGGI